MKSKIGQTFLFVLPFSLSTLAQKGKAIICLTCDDGLETQPANVIRIEKSGLLPVPAITFL